MTRCRNVPVLPASRRTPLGPTQRQMRGDAAEDERRQEGERHDEGVEESVVAPPHAVPHPGAVVVEALWKAEPEEP